MKKRNLIIVGGFITAIAIVALVILGYSMAQGKLVAEREVATKNEPYSEENVDNEIYYVAVEENEESKLNSIQAKEMAKSSAGVTIQQGNIVVSMNQKYTVNESLLLQQYGKHYRTQFGMGETVVIKVYFDKEIKNADASLYLRFGSGAERIATYKGASGSVLTFEYKIQSGDNGELVLTNLSGEVTDIDDNSIRIGLSQSGSIQYQDSSVIIADTARGSIITKNAYYTNDGYSQVRVEMVVNEYIYVKEGNEIKKLTSDNVKNYIDIKIGESISNSYNGKGTISNPIVNYTEVNTTEISYNYNIAEGDNGYFYTKVAGLVDIAGNEPNNNGYFQGQDIEIYTADTPYAISACLDLIDTNNAPEGYTKLDRYLKAGKKIRIGILYNEEVYSNRNQGTLNNGSGYVEIKFTNRNAGTSATKKAVLVESKLQSFASGKTGRYCVYEYVIQEGDGLSVATGTNDLIIMESEIKLPENQVFDRVGHGNKSKTFTGWKLPDSSIGEIIIDDGYTIHIDTQKPELKGAYIVNGYPGNKCYKMGEDIKIDFKFTEDIRIGNIQYRFGDSNTLRKGVLENSGNILLNNVNLTSTATVQSGDNGSIKCKFVGFTDVAGNELSMNADEMAYEFYADTEGPTIEMKSSNVDSETGIVKYVFNIKDNSDSYNATNKGALVGGIQHTEDKYFMIDDMQITNGMVIGAAISKTTVILEVLSASDGNQVIYVAPWKFEDGAGNGNQQAMFKTIVDTKEPVISSVDISPDDWTNESVKITVNAFDETSKIVEYCYNGKWSEDYTYEVNSEGNVEVKIKVKDESGLESEEKTVVISNIDKTSPDLELAKEENGKESAIIKISGTDGENGSGIEKCSINGIDVTLTNESYEYTATENGTYIVTVVDKAGNSTTDKIEITNIDITEKQEAVIIYETNGGTYTLNPNSITKLTETVYVTNIVIDKIEYAWTQSEEEPTSWENGGNTTGVSIEEEVTKEGKYYLYIKVTDKNGEETISHSNAFIVEKFPIVVDESIEINSIDGTNYIILSKETSTSELLQKITSNSDSYTVKVRNSDCTENTTGKVKNGDIITAEGENNYKLYKICIKGDIYKDGLIDMNDILLLNQYRLRNVELDAEQLYAANVDDNNQIDINDIFQINRYRLEKIESL